MEKFKNWFNHSETLFIARLKMFLGVAFTALQQSGVDIASFVSDPRWQTAIKVFFAWLILDGSLAEWARRRNADDLK